MASTAANDVDDVRSAVVRPKKGDSRRSDPTASTSPDRTARERRSDQSCLNCDQYQERVDDLSLQVLGAVDASRGAEAERAVAEGRIKDLEYQIHMLNVELGDLRQRHADNGNVGPPRGLLYRIARRVYREALGLSKAAGAND